MNINYCSVLVFVIIFHFASSLFGQPDLYWGNRADGIIKYSTRDDSLINLIPIPTALPRRIIYNSRENKIYWSDPAKGTIFRSDTAGLNLEVVFHNNTLSPYGLGLDENLLFFSEVDSGAIYKYDIANKSLEQIVSSLESPIDLEVDTINKRLFWIEQYKGKLSSSDYLGSNHNDIIDSVELALSCFAIDFTNSKFFLGDYVKDKIIVLDQGNDSIFNLPGINLNYIIDLKINFGENQIYWIEGSNEQIRKADLQGSNQITVYDLNSNKWGQTNLSSFTFDSNGNHIYYTDLVFNKLNKINHVSGSLDTLISTPINFPSAISVSQSANSIFWTERSTGEIKRSDLNGENIHTILVDTPATLAGLVIDEENGYIYWTNRYPAYGYIMRADTNGENKITFSPNILNIEGLALDTSDGDLYYTHAGSGLISSIQKGIIYYNGFGTGATTEIVIDKYSNKSYWSTKTGIYRAPLDSSEYYLNNPPYIATTIYESPTSCIAGMAMDIYNGKIYWVEDTKLFQSNMDGSLRITLDSSLHCGSIYNGKMTANATNVYVNDSIGYLCDDFNDCTFNTTIQYNGICGGGDTLTQDNTFIGLGSDWHQPSNWSLGVIPETCHNVIIPSPYNVQIMMNLSAACYTLDTEQGATLITHEQAILEVLKKN